MKLCPCGVPVRGLRSTYCASCVVERRRETLRRYANTPKGRARVRRYVASPKKKLNDARYQASHIDKVRIYRDRWNRSRRHPTVRTCATELCTSFFVLTGRNNAKKFCDPCRVFFGLAA